MAELVIRGGRRLSGRIAVEGNKNAALPLLAACLLTPEPCELRNVPHIRDVGVMIALLRSLGAEVEGEGTSTLRVTCRSVRTSEPNPALVGKLRGSVLLLGALVGRTGVAALAPPGGDFSARRTIGTHLRALDALGVRVVDAPSGHRIEAPDGLRGASMYLLEIYPNAPLRDAMARGRWSVAADDEAAEMYLSGLDRMDKAGYSQYEISNVALPGRELNTT